MPQTYLEAVAERVVVFDGATGTNLQGEDLGPDDFGGAHLEGCNEILVATRPDVVKRLHDSFLAIGADVVETDTFGGFSTVLAEYGLSDRAHELNVTAARLAREVADSYTDKQRYVAGSIGPGTKLPSLGHITYLELRDAFEEQAHGLIEGGVDLLIVETVYDMLQAKAAVAGCRRAMAAHHTLLPIQLQVTMETTGRMLVGSEIGAALTALGALKPDVMGLNCATGPREMVEHLRYLSQHAPMHLSCLPNAGLPSVVDGKTVYDLTPDQLRDHQARFVTELGVRVVGGCCGTTPEHIRQLVEGVAPLTPATRTIERDPGVSSLYSHVPFEQDSSVLLIGERTNANGSKAFREAMLAEDWEACEKIARDQIKEGSHLLDVCVDYVGRDGTADMDEIAQRFATKAAVPLVLDSTEPEVIAAALQRSGGRAVLNSANLEEGEEEGKRFDKIMTLARDHGAAVICLLIDEVGQARDVEWKMRVAHRIHDLAVSKYGLASEDLIFDALTFPVTTGDEDLRGDAAATIEGIRRIKAELPGVRTVLGLSNVSFGINPAARHVLNSVFLHECTEAGLDAAIVHAARIMPLSKIDAEQRQVCQDLIYDRRRPASADEPDGYDPLQTLLRMFEGVSAKSMVKEDRSGWPVERRLEARIVDGDRDGLTEDLDEALAGGFTALQLVNDVLLAGMKTVGELFATGEMQLPFVLQSAETMKKAVAHLEPHMEKVEGQSGPKGKVVLATVRGDVHDIGKNLVDIILTNNGYEVHNLGIKVGITEMIDAAEQVSADAIGMSGLLVKSTLIMRDNLVELNDRGLSTTPVLLGGAALTRTYVERDLREVYEGRVFYGKDAFEGLRVMERLVEMKRTGEEDPQFGRELSGRAMPERASAKRDKVREEIAAGNVVIPARSPSVADDNPIFVPPFLGSQVVKGIALDDVLAYLNETALFRNQWGFRPESGEDDKAFKDRVRANLRDQLAIAKQKGVLVPAVVYGYWAANADGDDVVLWADADRSAEVARFSFPRQVEDPYLCIADFFRPITSDEVDYAAFSIVTMGNEVSVETAKLFAENAYQDYLYLHGLGVEMAEALAELWHRRMREEMGFADEDGPTLTGLFKQQYRGGRYSWGYPACPDLTDNAKVADLLGADRIGVVVSEGFQLHPEQTTSAIICHHPQAKYFVA